MNSNYRGKPKNIYMAITHKEITLEIGITDKEGVRVGDMDAVTAPKQPLTLPPTWT